MRKKDLALEVIDRLKKCYPESDCTLDYNEAWKLLISVRLACLLYTSYLSFGLTFVHLLIIFANEREINALSTFPL